MARKHRILVADDDEMVRMVMRTVLAFNGYQIEEATNGWEAVRQYEESAGAIDLVLIDVNMPELDGKEALGRLRKMNPKLKAVLLSGGVHLGESSGEGQPVRYLQKPFSNEELVQVVGEMLAT